MELKLCIGHRFKHPIRNKRFELYQMQQTSKSEL